MKKILLTGDKGFIGSNFIRKVINENKYNIVGIDKILENHNHFNIDKDHNFYVADIVDAQVMNNIFKIEKPDIVVHMAASSHVDTSFTQGAEFVYNNVLGTQVMCDMSVKHNIEKFILVSTDESMGELDFNDKGWVETDSINPRNPYSASKASSELMVKAAGLTHKLPYIITRCCNNYGPRQPIRNLVPKIFYCIFKNEKIPLHGDPSKIYREWIYVDDHNSAILHLLEHGKLNEIYHIGSGYECTNLEMTNQIIDLVGKGKNLISYVENRIILDKRYYLNCDKIKATGWVPKYSFKEGLNKCVNWYMENKNYLLNEELNK
jgi:dTDP-glucose 4,6-dehydratase